MKGCVEIQTDGRWAWKLPLAKDRVITHHYNFYAPKIDGAHLRTETRPFRIGILKSVGVRDVCVEGVHVNATEADISADLGGSR